METLQYSCHSYDFCFFFPFHSCRLFFHNNHPHYIVVSKIIIDSDNIDPLYYGGFINLRIFVFLSYFL